MSKPQYKFLRPYAPHNIGDPVPDTYTPGMIQTMLDYKRIVVVAPKPHAPVEEPAAVKNVEVAPADKMVKGSNPKVHRKGVA